MRRLLGLVALVIAVDTAVALPRACAHGLIGKRFFPATLTIDDPFVADELSLPTVQYFKSRATREEPATRELSISGELSKRLTPDLGLSLGGAFVRLDPNGADSTSGFDNMEVALKYVVFKSAEHEMLLSVGAGWDVGGTGSKKIGAESFDTVTPTLFFGKGFGDLPDSLEFAKPLALTGAFGIAMPTKLKSRTVNVDADTGEIEVENELHPNVAQWGFSLQYNLQYLQSFVRDVGLPTPFNRMIPIVEFSMQTPIDRVRDAGRTTGTINPGIIWFGRYVQLGVEALVPVNARSGKNVGVVGQVHFYLDDIWPQIFTWTPFHGVLGPTQAR